MIFDNRSSENFLYSINQPINRLIVLTLVLILSQITNGQEEYHSLAHFNSTGFEQIMCEFCLVMPWQRPPDLQSLLQGPFFSCAVNVIAKVEFWSVDNRKDSTKAACEFNCTCDSYPHISATWTQSQIHRKSVISTVYNPDLCVIWTYKH